MKKMNKDERSDLIVGIICGSAVFGTLGSVICYGAYEKGAFAPVQEMYVTDANWKMEVPIGVMKTEHKRVTISGGRLEDGAYNIHLVGRRGKAGKYKTYEYDIDVFTQTRKLTFSGEGVAPTDIPYIDLSDGEVIGDTKLCCFIIGEIDDNDVTVSINPKDYNGTIVGHIYDVKVTPKSKEVVYIKSKK